jgi:beta-carotene hydroxylase
MLRYRADIRTLAYLGLTVALAAVQWHLGSVHPVLYPLSLFMGVATAVISHNHNHLGIWKKRSLNLVTSYVIAIFYGYPAIGWVPTHNQVHHKRNNREGDSSRSPKVFKSNHLLALLIYPTLTGLAQSKEIGAFIKDLWRRDRRAFFAAISEYVVFFGFMLAIFLIDWRKALLFFLIPQQFALFMIQVFNYVQHVEADAESKWNHSRNFVSPVLNALLFNNGYHTVHHHKPGLHWTQTPALHAECAHRIHPALLVKSWWGYMVYTFLLRPFIPGARHPDLQEVGEVNGGTDAVGAA